MATSNYYFSDINAGDHAHQTIHVQTEGPIGREIVGWLSDSLPKVSDYHNSARDRHEETTGTWLIEGEKLRLWTTTKNSFMWLNGGAGAGKTILCSTVIDHLQKNYSDPSSPVIYWYFFFADDATQDVSNLLRSIVTDLCSNSSIIPDIIQQAYSAYNNGRQQPTSDSLYKMLKTLFGVFTHVYLVIDALDEYPPERRDALLKTLAKIRKLDADILHLLATSRREKDIEDAISYFDERAEGYWDVDVQGIHIQEDIKIYVNHRLENEIKFKHWAPDEREKVKIRLAERADGMFRLVALQLDVLAGASSKKKRRIALEELPRTLDSFYERILNEIPQDEKEKAHRALCWLAYSMRPMTLVELAEAVLIDLERPSFDVEDRYDNEEVILSIIPVGLRKIIPRPPEVQDSSMFCAESGREKMEKRLGITKRPSSPIIQFAHFSVQEYLRSNRVETYYQIPGADYGHGMLSSACSSYLIFIGNTLDPSMKEQMTEISETVDYLPRSLTITMSRRLVKEFPMFEYVYDQWFSHTKEAGDICNPKMDELFLELCSSSTDGLLVYLFMEENGYISHGANRDDDRFRELSPIIKYEKQDLGGLYGITRASKAAFLLALNGLNRQITLLLDSKLIPRPETDDQLVIAALLGLNTDTLKLFPKEGLDVNWGSESSTLSLGIYRDIFPDILKVLSHSNSRGRRKCRSSSIPWPCNQLRVVEERP